MYLDDRLHGGEDGRQGGEVRLQREKAANLFGNIRNRIHIGSATGDSPGVQLFHNVRNSAFSLTNKTEIPFSCRPRFAGCSCMPVWKRKKTAAICPDFYSK